MSDKKVEWRVQFQSQNGEWNDYLHSYSSRADAYSAMKYRYQVGSGNYMLKRVIKRVTITNEEVES